MPYLPVFLGIQRAGRECRF
uniref:Uncharacterized protein n=1 Tax=Arundo donax TaxID=35708 RepID=A0A0A9E568_ARUDO